jgi:hypothetical protein
LTDGGSKASSARGSMTHAEADSWRLHVAAGPVGHWTRWIDWRRGAMPVVGQLSGAATRVVDALVQVDPVLIRWSPR